MGGGNKKQKYQNKNTEFFLGEVSVWVCKIFVFFVGRNKLQKKRSHPKNDIFLGQTKNVEKKGFEI